MVTIKLTPREVRTLELSFSQANEPPYNEPPDVVEHIEAIKAKLIAAKLRSAQSK